MQYLLTAPQLHGDVRLVVVRVDEIAAPIRGRAEGGHQLRIDLRHGFGEQPERLWVVFRLSELERVLTACPSSSCSSRDMSSHAAAGRPVSISLHASATLFGKKLGTLAKPPPLAKRRATTLRVSSQ